MQRFVVALLLASLGPVGLASAQEEAEQAPAAAPAAQTKGGKRKAKSRHAKVEGRVVPESKLRDTPLPRPSGDISLATLATHESLKVNIYNEDGSYDVDALREASHLLRCKRTDDVKDIEPRLLMILSHVYDHFGERRIEIVSGYRNQRRTTSFHYRGSATDIRVAGVPPKKLKAFLETLDEGGMGIGIYPRSNFIHVDVRPPPSYRWTDWSRANPNSPDKRPPRGWKRKKLQS